MPDIPYRAIDGVWFFKGMLVDLKAQVDQEAASLSDAKQAYNEQCGLELKIKRISDEMTIIQDYLKD